MAPPKGLTRREGTTNHGSTYEQRIAALLGVKCVLDDDVEDMWIATNIKGLGAFDDVVLFVQKKNENCTSKELYLIQIKYKKNKKLFLTTHDNDLMKYQQTFLQIKRDFSKESNRKNLASCSKFENIKFLLFTNTQIDTSNIQIHDCSSDDFINTGKIFQILKDANTAYDPDFLKQTYFYYNQIDVSKVTNIIKKETNKYFINCDVGAITKFFESWHSEQFESKVALEKEDIQSLILEIVLSNYIPEPTTVEFTNANIWNEVAIQFKVIFIKHEDYLAKIWQGVKVQLCTFFDDQNIDLLNWDKPLIQASNQIKRIKQCPLKVHPIIKKDKTSYTFKDVYLLLWQVSEVPLILNLNTKSQKDIVAALSKLDQSYSSGKRYIFIGEPTSDLHHRFARFNFFDIDRDTREFFLENSYISLQGKEAVALKELKLNDGALEKITPDLLIDLLQPITKKIDPDPGYLPRFVLQPTVAVDVLTIPNVVFVVVVDDNSNLSTLEELGIVVSWSLYRLFTNKFVKTTTPDNFNTKWINIIILNNISSLKEYKNIEDTVREVRKCKEQTIHYLQFLDENRLQWLNSNRDANQITPFLISNSTSELPDSELFPCLTFNILSGKAGDGKSTLLHFLANNSPANVWVIELKMREISEYTEKGDFSGMISFLFQQSNEETDHFKEFSLALFQSLYTDRNILLVIDGIDELEYNSNVEKMLVAVKSLGIKVIISTRPSLRDTLEKIFDMPLLSLKPFTDEDCQSLIKLTLRNNYEELSEIDINKILPKVSSWSNIIGIPLLLKLFITLLNNRVFRDFSDFDICDLFDSFINEQLRNVDTHNKFTIRTLSRSALFVLYKEDAISQIFNIKEYFEDVDDKIELFVNSKIIEKLDKNKIPIFAHKSLAEFLVAKYIFGLAESSIVPQTFLMSLFYKELETVRLFFDMIALKGSGLQGVIIDSNLPEFRNTISNDFVDKFGRNSLHIAASYGNRCELRTTQSLWSGVRIYESYNNVQDNIITPCHKFVRRTVVSMNFVSQLLQKNVNLQEKDNLFKMNVFEFAIESGSLEIIEALCSRKYKKELRNINKNVLLFNVVKNGYINIFRKLRDKNIHLKISPDMDNLLHIALFSEELRIIKELCNGAIRINEPNDSGYTPLMSWLTLSKSNSKHYSLSMDTLSLNDNQLSILNYLIDKNINLNVVNDQGETALHILCSSQDASVIKKLIENGAEVNRKTMLGNTPLHYASRYSMQNVELLIEKYMSAVDIPNNIGYTPVYDAIQDNKVDIMEYLIKKGANVNRNKDGLSPLNAAVSRGYVECARLLLKKGAQINQTNINNTLAFAILFGDLNCVKLLLAYGAILHNGLLDLILSLNRKQIIEFVFSQKLINITNVNSNELLYHSVRTNDTDLIDILISYGADVNAKKVSDEDTPLHLACNLNLKETVKHLIKHKSNVNAENKLGNVPLIQAATLKNLEILKILVNSGSDLQKYGPDALCAAVTSDSSDIFDYLISAGVDINGINSRGYASIHTASKINIYWVRKLKRMGADIKLKSVNDGFTTVTMAALEGLQDVAEYLIENGANINEETWNRRTALAMASQQGHLECVKFLIDKGSDLRKYGPLAIYMAALNHHIPIIDCLISAGADINGIVELGKAPIHVAVSQSDVKVVDYLLNKGADVNIKTVLDGHTPLMVASYEGRSDIIEFLLENGANVNEEVISYHYTALYMASQEGHLECVKFLIDKGSDLRKYGALAIYAASLRDQITVTDYLISVGADINGKIYNNKAPIHLAVLDSNVKSIEHLLKKGANIHTKTVLEGCTPLMLASLKGRQDIIEYLIENGAKINEESSLNHQTALIITSQEGHLDCVKLLMDKGSDVQKYGPSAISVAAIEGNITVIDFLISAGADINGTVDNDKFPIHVAVLESNIKAIEYLLRKGADIDIKTVLDGCTALMFASFKGRQEIIEFLIENGAKINEESLFHQTALTIASQEGHLECAKFLVSKGSDVRKYGSRAISIAAVKCHITVIDYLISLGVDINGIVDNDNVPIHDAVLGGNIKTIECLLKKGANVNVKTVLKGSTPLMIASLKGRLDIIEYLIENGAKINQESNLTHETALTMASHEGHLECVKFLIDKGSDLRKYGPLAIYMAALKGQFTLIDYFISTGVDINGTVDKNKSPIHIAALQGNVKAIGNLLRKGANIHIKTVLEGVTPLMIASLEGRQDIIEYLIENGADINEETSNHHTALTMASQQGHLGCVKLLIDKNCDLRKYGSLAISVAAIKGHINVIDYLISAGADINGKIYNNTFVNFATLKGNVKSIGYLLEKGGANNIKTTEIYSNTPLILAAIEGNKDTVEYLIGRGAEVNYVNACGLTALTYACARGHLECVKILIDKGSNLSKYGLLALYAAAFMGHLAIVNCLTSYISR